MVKTQNSQRSKSKIAIAIILALVVAIGAAFAFLTARDEKVNTFTYGKVDIEVVEPLWDAANPDGIIEKVVPTKSYDKDPAITNTGDNNAYVYMRVWMPKVDDVDVFVDEVQNDGTYIKSENDFELFSTVKNENASDAGVWNLVEGYEYKDEMQAYNYYVYAYSVPLAPGETSATLFDQIVAANIAHGEENIVEEFQNIVIEGFAIQAETGDTTFASAADAWNMYIKQEGYQWPDNPVSNYVSFISYDKSLAQRSAYSDKTETIVMPELITPNIPKTDFIGWIDEAGNIHSSNKEITIEDLYVLDTNTKEPINLNPVLQEVIVENVYNENINLSKPIKLIPINENSTAVIERCETENGSNVARYETYNEIFCPVCKKIDRDDYCKESLHATTSNVITEIYGYNNPAKMDEWYVYGIKENITIDDLFNDYVTVQGDGYATISASAGTYVGTGSVVKVYDRNGTESNTDDVLIEQFTVILYGDINGDSKINEFDYAIAWAEAFGSTEWSAIYSDDYQHFKAKAANISADNVFSSVDATQINFFTQGLVSIDQTTGVVGDPI